MCFKGGRYEGREEGNRNKISLPLCKTISLELNQLLSGLFLLKLGFP